MIQIALWLFSPHPLQGHDIIQSQPHQNVDALTAELGKHLQQMCLCNITQPDPLTYDVIVIEADDVLKSLTPETFYAMLQKLNTTGMLLVLSAIRIALNFFVPTFKFHVQSGVHLCVFFQVRSGSHSFFLFPP